MLNNFVPQIISRATRRPIQLPLVVRVPQVEKYCLKRQYFCTRLHGVMSLNTKTSDIVVFRRVHKKRRVTLSFIVSVCLSIWNNSAPTEWILMKLDI